MAKQCTTVPGLHQFGEYLPSAAGYFNSTFTYSAAPPVLLVRPPALTFGEYLDQSLDKVNLPSYLQS